MWYFLPLLAPALLFILYPLAVQYERGGNFKYLFPLYVLAGIASALTNFTVAILVLWDIPKHKEITLSQRLERLVYDAGWRGKVARVIARYTNRFDPTGPHIPLP